MDARSAIALVTERAGAEVAERLEHLDRVRCEPVVTSRPRVDPPDAAARPDVDVVLAGGGLSLLVAAELARRGVSVLVIERARAGVAHREWNASRAELEPLIGSGLVSRGMLEGLVVSRYDRGFCAFHGGRPHEVRGVLDHAVDAGPLLAEVRRVAERRGVRFLDGARVTAEASGASSVRVLYEDATGAGEVVARILVDGRGASSPHAGGADLVCPTVGGVMRGLVEGEGRARYRRDVGEILVTTEHADRGRQHVWEGFPGRAGELTVYLFHYADSRRLEPNALAHLYARFFTTLSTYKEGIAELVRPTFGLIPGWSRLGPAPRAPGRVVLVGDAAARHSPLTFCGFGAMLRSFEAVARRVVVAVSTTKLPPDDADERVHAWTGPLAKLMASCTLDGAEQNALLDAAFGTLAEMGQEPYAALLQDRMEARAFFDFVMQTSRKRPRVFAEVMRGLGPWKALSWGARVARDAHA